jgi:hypothetical protein
MSVPGLVYVCDPETVKEPADPVIVPAADVPSPHSMSAESALAASETSASVTVATVPVNATPAVAVTATALATSCVLHVEPMQLWVLGHTLPQLPQFAGSVCLLTHEAPQSEGVCPPQLETHAYVPPSFSEHAVPPPQVVPHAPQVEPTPREVAQPVPASAQSA